MLSKMLRISRIILIFAVLKIVACFDWDSLKNKVITELEPKARAYKLESLSNVNGSIACFRGTRKQDSQSLFMKIFLLKDDKDDKLAHEFIQEFYKIKEQRVQIYTKLCLKAIVMVMKLSFIAYDVEQLPQDLENLGELDYNNLTGAEVIDYVNSVTYPNDNEQLVEFSLEHQIPAKPSENIEAVFYMATVLKNTRSWTPAKAVVVIPLQANNTQFLKNELHRLNSKTAKRSTFFQRLVKNGYINGRPTPFLAIQLGRGNFNNTLIEGLSTTFVAYTNFIGDKINLTAWERIHINGDKKSPDFQSLNLSDYKQDPNVEWGSFNSTIIPLDESDECGTFDVELKVLFLPLNTKDKMLCAEYDKMNDEKEKYQFLCYCEEAKVDTKRVAFIAFKLLDKVVVNEEHSNLKRKRDSSVEIIDQESKRRI